MQLTRGNGSGTSSFFGIGASGDARRRRRTRENVVPLINVIFLLLVFFMLAGTLRSPSPLAVALPGSPGMRDAAPERAKEGPRVAVLSATGELALDGRRLASEDLGAALSAALAGDDALELRADAAVPARILLPLLETLDRAGISRVDLVTRRER